MVFDLFAEACAEYGGRLVEAGGVTECIVDVGPGELPASLWMLARLASMAGAVAEVTGRPVAVVLEAPMGPEYGVVRVEALPEGGYRVHMRLFSEESIEGMRGGAREESVTRVAGVPVHVELYPWPSPRERVTWAAVEAAATTPTLATLSWLYEHLTEMLPQLATRYLERIRSRRRRWIPLPV